MNKRSQVLDQLADLIVAVVNDHPLRVAIDGVDAAGKTMLADEMAPLIESRGRPVIRASIDGFHQPRAIRYRQGSNSPRGYYQDSFDNSALLDELLIPLGPGGNRKYRRSVFDYRVDAPAIEPKHEISTDAILLFDGVFLLRPALVNHWDLRIFVDVDFCTSVPRAVKRDLKHSLGESKEAISERYCQRYVPGQRLYLEEAKPKQHADVIFDNNQLEAPAIIVETHVNGN